MRLSILFVIAITLGAVGCVSPDVTIRNPLTAQTVDANRILKHHDYIERQRGLPAGSMGDEATLLSGDAARICFGVRLHEMQGIDMRQVTVNFTDDKGQSLDTGELYSDPPTQTTYNGLVPVRRQVGVQRVCTAYYGGYCVAWAYRPLYAITYVPGPVPVFETVGRICFPNQKMLTPTTEWLSLELRLPKSEGWGGTKRVRFVWGFPKSKG